MNCSTSVVSSVDLGSSARRGGELLASAGVIDPGSHTGNLLISAMVVGGAFFGFNRLYRAMQDGAHM